jgi:hypothetical protein
MESAVPWQRFEPSKCILGQRQQNKRYPSAEYMSLSYKDSMVEMPALQIITPWLNKSQESHFAETTEMGWATTEHSFFQKIKILHEQMRQNLLANHHIKLNANNYILSIYFEKGKTLMKNITTDQDIRLEDSFKTGSQQYKLCIRLAGIHLQHGTANYRFKCVNILARDLRGQ